MGILQTFQRRRVRRALEAYLSPEAVEKLLRQTKSEIGPPQVKHFQFVLILFDESNPQAISALINGAVRTLFEHKATVTNISPWHLVGLLGISFPEGNPPEARRAVVQALLKDNDKRIRLAHGECDAPVGIFGGNLRPMYDAAIPGLLGILKKLLEAAPGSLIEVS